MRLNRKGAISVIVALSLTAIAGLAALVIDVGMIYYQKQEFQAAIDAAVLAAAQELPDTAAARSTADQYIQLNGFTPEDILVTFADSNHTVSIQGSKQVELWFGRLLGFQQATLAPLAAASRRDGGLSAVFDYAVFSGSSSKDLIFNGRDIYIDGHTHTNDSFLANGQHITVTGRCEAVRSVTINGQSITIPNRYPNSAAIAMPDFASVVEAMARTAGTYYSGDRTFNATSLNLDQPIYVNGKVIINGSNFTGQGCIVASGEIVINGSTTDVSAGDGICLYSRTSRITINGENAKVDGILYAPNGTITLNGGNQRIAGRVVGKEVVLNGGGISVCAGSSAILDCLPLELGVKLTR